MKEAYDVIVVGGGINGLAAAGYMAKCGLDVAVFEARNEVGTNCDTEEVGPPGVRFNLHASGICTLSSPAYEELELERFGIEMVGGDWGQFKPFRDGTAVVFHGSDMKKTCESLALINKKDAETFRVLANYMEDKISEFWHEMLYVNPNPKSFFRLGEIISGMPGVPPNWADMTAYHLADILFESDKIKTFLYDAMIQFGMLPWLKSVGSMGLVLFMFYGPAPNGFTCRGGSHLLPHSLYRSLLHYGGEVYQACPVVKIIVENGEAKGIVLGEESVYSDRKIMAKKAVISNLTPVPTFKWLVGEENLPPEVNMAVSMYDYEAEVLITNYWVLNEPLKFNMYEWTTKNLDPAFEKEAYDFNFGMEDPGDYTRLLHCLARGELPDPPIVTGGCFCFTNIDPTQAPPGMHTVMTWTEAPYNIRRWGDRKLNGPESWDDIREEYGDRIEDLLAEYAPNIKTASVYRYIHTPLDIARRNASMISGTWSGGPAWVHQFYHNRPFPGCGAPRSPIKNLYITECSFVRSTLLTGGYNAASALAEDLGIRNQPWWNVRAVEPYQRWCERHGRTWRMKF
ncbi:MAG: NAD(P)/FAD-dependent oxidoreductase [Thermodesulfobacteriota bacterium]|nr:NAD(P)/FAD-dependent oxidoreductase [Thermodesulfobacteriota bacterium]